MIQGWRKWISPFRIGVAIGFLLPFGVVWGINYALTVGPDGRVPRFDVEVSSIGSDVSRHGGVRLVIDDEHGKVVQSCQGGCDDLRLQRQSSDNGFRVSVLDATGRCVACTQDTYVDGSSFGDVSRFVVSGQDRLAASFSVGPPVLDPSRP